jgi:hypothetical protein
MEGGTQAIAVTRKSGGEVERERDSSLFLYRSLDVTLLCSCESHASAQHSEPYVTFHPCIDMHAQPTQREAYHLPSNRTCYVVFT